MIAVSDAASPDDSTPGSRACVLGPIDGATARRRGAALAHALSAARGTALLVDDSVSMREATSTDADEETSAATPLPESHRETHQSPTTPLSIGEDLQPAVDLHRPSGVVLERDSSSFFDGLRADRAERLAAKTDVLTVDGRGKAEPIASILVPVAGGHHSQLAAEAAVALGLATDAAVDLFHVIESDTDEARARGQRILDGVHASLGDHDRIDTWVFEAVNTAEAIIEQSRYYDLTVMGAPTAGPLERFVFGSLSKRVQAGAESPVVVAHAAQP